MTAERFGALAAAYGAALHRWPAAERAEAEGWMLRHQTEADAMLSSAAQLDDWLAADTVAPPDAALQRRILDAAAAFAPMSAHPVPAAVPVVRPARKPASLPFWRRPRLVWSGLGFAGIGLAGAAAGVFAVSILISAVPVRVSFDAPYAVTAFGNPPAFDRSSE